MTACSAGFSCTSLSTLACHSGSLAAWAIIVERQSVTIDTSAPRLSVSTDLALLWQVAQRPDPVNRGEVPVGNTAVWPRTTEPLNNRAVSTTADILGMERIMISSCDR